MKVSRFKKSAAAARGGGGVILPPETAGALERSGDLHLTARTMVEGLYQGRHQTRQRGASTEFYDFRAYAPGDPAYRVDWKVYGRTDRLYVRRFRHTSQLTVMLVVDASASMEFAGLDGRTAPGPTKSRRARELAAALAFLAVRQSDRVGVIVRGSGRDPAPIPPGAGRGALHAVISRLESAPIGDTGKPDTGAGVAEGIDAAAQMLTRRSLIIAIGDALDDPERLLEAAARARYGNGGSASGHDLALIQTLTPDELDIASLGGANLVDCESAQSVRTLGRSVAEGYRRAMDEHLRRVREGMAGMGARCIVASTADPAIESLRSFLASA